MRKLVVGLIALISGPLAGCISIQAPKEVVSAQMCKAPRYVLEAEPNDQGFLERNASFKRSITAKYLSKNTGRSLVATSPVTPSMLLLSGGSQHGAFGAGALGEWSRKRPGGLPRFRVVTGISTGAIMATHAFLNRADIIEDSYRITHEREILQAYVRSRDLKSLRDIYTTVRKGAVGNLIPMRTLLASRVTDDMLRQVAAEADDRSLLVGTVDMELGKAVVFDMTALARNFAQATDPARQRVLRDCYFDIILASSSVPLAAPPTFVDNRMYIDGGARFGVIAAGLEQVAASLDVAGLVDPVEPSARPNIYVIINGNLDIDHKCRKVAEADCKDPQQASGAQRPWNLPELAKRSVSILIDQVYRLSNERVHLLAKDSPFVARTMRIDEGLEAFASDIRFPGELNEVRTCETWHKIDAAKEGPVEFFPRYMHCLVRFGANRLEARQWYCRDPLPASVSTAEKAVWLSRCRQVLAQPDWEPLN